MKLYIIVPIAMLLCSFSMFGADMQETAGYTLDAGVTEKYYVPQVSFNASRKICNIHDRKIVYGNVLCAKKHEFPHGYTIVEIWYCIKKEIQDYEHGNKGLNVKILAKQELQHDQLKENQLNSKASAFDYILKHSPRGLDVFGKTCVLSDTHNPPLREFVVPRSAVLLSLLRGGIKSNESNIIETAYFSTDKEKSILCVSEYNELTRITFPSSYKIKLDEQKKIVFMKGMSGSIDIPQQFSHKVFNTQQEALDALDAHINSAYFTLKTVPSKLMED